MKVLLTGGTGFLGSHLIKGLLRNGHEVVLLKRSFSDTSRIDALLSQVAVYDIDLTGIERPFKEQGTSDALIHAAACYGRAGEGTGDLLETNVLFPLRLLEMAIKYSTGVFMNAGTSLPSALNAYALSKSQFSEWGALRAQPGKIRFVDVKLEHFYGPNDDDTKFPSHIVRSCLRNISELALTAGEQKRDFLFIDDAVQGFLTLLETWQAAEPGYCQYQLGSGQVVSVRDFVELVHRLCGSATVLKFGAVPYRENEVMWAEADTRDLQALGWACGVVLEEGLRRTIAAERELLKKEQE